MENKLFPMLRRKPCPENKIWRYGALCWLLVMGMILILFILLRAFGLAAPDKRSLACCLLFFSLLICMIVVHIDGTDRPALVFFIIGLHIGLLLIMLEPVAVNQSWDDQIHYQRALNIAYGGKEICTAGELAVMEIRVSFDLSAAVQRGVEQTLRTLHTSGEMLHYHLPWPKSLIPSYLSMAAGLWIGRIFHLSLPWCLRAGKIGNLLCYLAVMSAAIHLTKRGKRTVMALGLIPTVLFMASNYSYDPWCISWMTLGTVLFLEYRASDDTLADKPSWKVMLLAFFFACLTKQFYLPLWCICFFLPRSKFRSTEEHRAYITAALVLMVLSVLLLSIPYLKDTLYITDPRGGADVNARQQLHTILAAPVTYVKTILRFVFQTFLFPIYVLGETVNMAYVSLRGGGFPQQFCQFVALAILVSFFLDSRPVFDRKRLVLPVIGLVCVLVSAFVIASTLYVSFTSVGRDTVAGCQIRYVHPLGIFLILIISNSISRERKQSRWMNLAFDCSEALFMLAGLLPLVRQVYA